MGKIIGKRNIGRQRMVCVGKLEQLATNNDINSSRYDKRGRNRHCVKRSNNNCDKYLIKKIARVVFNARLLK